MAVGMNDYLAKPVRMDELAKVLDTWLVTGSHVEHLVKKSGNPSDTHQLFDEAQLLENFDGDDDFAKGILADALTELPKYIVTLQELFKGEDIQAIHLQAHTIKGIAANLCTPALLIIACQLEMAAKNGSMAETRDLFPELEQTLLMTLEEIRG